jgi:Ca2+-transporting ATPase
MIAKVGGSVALLLFIILFIKFCISLPNSPLDAGGKGQQFMQILIVSVTIVVVAVPEGLPLAVTLAFAYATARMLRDNNLVRVLKACETMGNATTICSDKTGTLTQNKMSVVAGTLGVNNKFGEKPQMTSVDKSDVANVEHKGAIDNGDAIPMQRFFEAISPEMRTLLRLSIALNTTAFEGTDENGNKEFIGSKTETALLNLAKDYLGMDNVSTERHNAQIVQIIPFSSERKSMGCVVKTEVDGNVRYRLYVKGASEIVLKHCTRVVDQPWAGNLTYQILSDDDRKDLDSVIVEYATKSLRTIGLVYRDFPKCPPSDTRLAGDDQTPPEFDDIFKDMIFIGIVGIMDPLRPGVAKAVEDCRRAGVSVRMVTGDNVLTATAIATECGIYTPGGIVMEAPQFRMLSPPQMDQIVPRLQVLARSSPEDKRVLVKRLKELGETVAVTGDGTNDGPALKMADVGFSMGIAGTEVAKEASSIILMDDNFTSIVKAIMWGRCVSDAVKKFLQVLSSCFISLQQFQLTVNITAVVLAFVSSIAEKKGESALTAVQLLWVNLIMDTFAALALATDPPTPELLDRKPDPKGASIISFNMWKMITGQAVLQLVITFILNFAGRHIFTGWEEANMKTVVFNTFVWLQIFNEINCRRLDNKLNVFSGIHRNHFFITITLIMIGGQILIIFVGGTAFSTTRITGEQWAASIVLGFLALPVGVIIRLIPNEFIKIFIPRKLSWFKRGARVIDEETISGDRNCTFDMTRQGLANIEGLELHKDTDPNDPVVGRGAANYSPVEINRLSPPVALMKT